MKIIVTFCITVFTFLVLLPVKKAYASTVSLSYAVTELSNGRFNYDFSLRAEDGKYAFRPGDGWGVIVFGDVAYAESNLTDFIGDKSSLPYPFNGFTTSIIAHNGPTLSSTYEIWKPEKAGDTLNWSGTSTANLSQGELLWSALTTSGNARLVNMAIATRLPDISPVPLPAGAWLFGSALIGFGVFGRTRKRSKSPL